MFLLKELDQYAKKIKLKHIEAKPFVWDALRKKWLACLPEELVRQALVQYLVMEYKYPKSKFQTERAVRVNEYNGRFDLLVCDKSMKPFLLVECKAFNTTLSQKNFDQLAVYNTKIGAPYIALTNGIHVSCLHLQDEKYNTLNDFPLFPN